MRSVFFVPIFNQVDELPTLLAELKAQPLLCDHLLLVNNGCNDGSEILIRESGFDCLELPENFGVGHAIIRSIEWALERNFDIIGGLAGNAKMLPSEMERVLNPILQGEADYVTGSRFLKGGSYPNLPLFRRATIPMVNILAGVLSGVRITDATCGYRAYKLDIIRRAKFDWKSESLFAYSFEYFLYAKVLQSRKFVAMEVPITMRYPPSGKRYTKIRAFTDWWDMLKPWIVARFDTNGFE